ncbi:MAG: hypothetical protein ACOH2F_20135 [Cellulomonas sp.]
MYGWLWRHLPGPIAARAAMLLVAVFVLLTVCFLWVFPAIAPLMPFNNTTVGG